MSVSATASRSSALHRDRSVPLAKYCGAIVTVTVTTISVSLIGLTARPAVGWYGDLYGITGAGTLTATGFVVRDSSGVCTNPALC